MVSLVTAAQKAKLFFTSVRARAPSVESGPVNLGGVEVPAAVAQLGPIKALKEKFEANLLDRHRLFCAALLGLCEGTATRLRMRLAYYV